MNTIRPLIAITLLLCANTVRAAGDALDLEGLFATAKYAGFCGALKQLAAFQETTQMPGGRRIDPPIHEHGSSAARRDCRGDDANLRRSGEGVHRLRC